MIIVRATCDGHPYSQYHVVVGTDLDYQDVVDKLSVDPNRKFASFLFGKPYTALSALAKDNSVETTGNKIPYEHTYRIQNEDKARNDRWTSCVRCTDIYEAKPLPEEQIRLKELRAELRLVQEEIAGYPILLAREKEIKEGISALEASL